MRSQRKLDWTIVALCAIFIIVLAESAYFEADIRGLHFFQSLIYVAIAVLSLKHSKWGYAMGISIAAFWDGVNIFATSFIRNGFQSWAEFITTGHINNPVTFVAAPAGVDHLLLIICCAWAYARLNNKKWRDVGILFGGAVASIGYFAGSIVIFGPQFMPLLKRVFLGHA
jgi:hypothetical protein